MIQEYEMPMSMPMNSFDMYNYFFNNIVDYQFCINNIRGIIGLLNINYFKIWNTLNWGMYSNFIEFTNITFASNNIISINELMPNVSFVGNALKSLLFLFILSCDKARAKNSNYKLLDVINEFCILFGYNTSSHNEKYARSVFVFDDFFITARQNSIHHTLCVIDGENTERIIIAPNIMNLSIGLLNIVSIMCHGGEDHVIISILFNMDISEDQKLQIINSQNTRVPLFCCCGTFVNMKDAVSFYNSYDYTNIYQKLMERFFGGNFLDSLYSTFQLDVCRSGNQQDLICCGVNYCLLCSMCSIVCPIGSIIYPVFVFCRKSCLYSCVFGCSQTCCAIFNPCNWSCE
jgi:hypothetical protein